MKSFRKRAGSSWGYLSQRGVSLVEFMVASAIGLVLILGAATLMSSSFQGEKVKGELDLMQENFRYGSSVIMRVVRQGESFSIPFVSNRLTVSFPENSDPDKDAILKSGSHDCLGNLAGEPNTFFVDADSGELRCEIGDQTVALADGFCSLTVAYGVDAQLADGVIDDYIEPNGYMADAVSARITLAVKFDPPQSENDECRSISFVTTMRKKVVAKAAGIVVGR